MKTLSVDSDAEPFHLAIQFTTGKKVRIFVSLFCIVLNTEKKTTVDKLRSILAQLHYRHTVREWDANGVPFRTFMYVPEVHHISNKVFHEREDEGHLFKVYVHSKTCVY